MGDAQHRDLEQWESHFPGMAASAVACLTGFALALIAEAFRSDRGELKIGLAGLVGNALIAAWWAFIVVAAWAGS